MTTFRPPPVEGTPPGARRPGAALLTLGLALASAACTGPAPIRVEAQPSGGYCARVAGQYAPAEVRPLLLLGSADATLAAGGRYFRLLGVVRSGLPSPPMNPDSQTAGSQEGTMCFVVLQAPSDHPDAYDSLAVIEGSSPALRSRLSPEARRRFEAEGRGPSQPPH